MKELQDLCMEIMESCLVELKRTTKINLSNITVENGLFTDFTMSIRNEVMPRAPLRAPFSLSARKGGLCSPFVNSHI